MLGRKIGLFFGGLLSFCFTLGEQIIVPQGSFAAELEDIKARGYLIVGVKDNLRPLGYRTSAGTLEGFEIDLARRLAVDLLGKPDALVLHSLQNQERLPAVLSGDVDLVVAGVTQTSSRSRIVSFSIPYYMDGTVLLTRDGTAQNAADLSRQTIALLEGSSAVPTIRYLFPNANLVGVSSYAEAQAQLERNQAQAFAGDSSILSGWVQEYPDYRILPEILSAEPLGIVMPKGLQHDELRRQVNRSVTNWHEEGWLRDRVEAWGLLTSSWWASNPWRTDRTPRTEDQKDENQP